ncbi:MAG: TonB-dependent receptor [Saprospiraceae bacterium]|nr:TonB-dependent receptor [Saprospiraceae bacterium]
MRCSYLIVLCALFQHVLPAQSKPDTIPPVAASIDDALVNGDYRGISLVDLLSIWQERFGVKFYFDPEIVPQYKVYIQFKDDRFYAALRKALEGNNLAFSLLSKTTIVIAPRQSLNKEYALKIAAEWEAGRYTWPDRNLATEMSLSFGSSSTSALNAKAYKFRGKLTDEKTGEAVIGATFLVQSLERGAATDPDGRFELSLPPGKHQILVQSVGYRNLTINLEIFKDGQADIALEQFIMSLDEVIVSAKYADANVRNTQIGVENLSVKTIRELPSLLGEPDLIKGLETLAGVSTVGEGAAGFNVRGGNIDQNLVLQDGAAFFNTSHALGFYSVFNTDIISNVSLYKGAIPAQFGGRTSSVLDVQLRDGNFQEYHGGGGIGIAYSRLSLEGPIWRNRVSAIAAVRASYSNWLLRLARQYEIKNSAVNFYDFTAKLSFKITDRQTLTLTGFQSSDYFRYSREFGYDWTNQNAVLGWNIIFSDRFSSAFKAVASKYSSSLFEDSATQGSRLRNGLTNFSLRQSVFFQANSDWEWMAGVEASRYLPEDERLAPYGNTSTVAPMSLAKDRGDEWAAFLQTEGKISERLAFSAGIRYSGFIQRGPRSVYTYQEGVPKEIGTIIGVEDYGENEAIQQYSGLEPRFSVKLQLGPDRSIKASYNLMRQYIHLISNTAAATPVDLWQVSNRHIRPQLAHVYSLGYFHNFQKNLWQLSLEAYYKNLDGIVAYKEIPRLLLNEYLETELLTAVGKAYGAEFSLRKTSGRWSGQLSYAWSRSLLQTRDAFPEETVNEGAWFPSNFDQPHQITLSLKRQVNPMHTFSVSFTYRSGRPYTTAEAGYSVGGVVIAHYSQRNEGRIPDYHRLDISYTVDKTEAKEKGYRSNFTFSLYNLYARKNAFSVFYKRNAFNQQQVYRLAVIGTALPAISYNFIF